MSTSRRWRHAALVLLATATLATGAVAESEEPAVAETEEEALARDLSVCAAYYFNATNVTPMTEYEAVYSAGERAFNRAVAIMGRKAVDDAMAEASAQMTALMAQSWQYFHRVDERYGAPCAELDAMADE